VRTEASTRYQVVRLQATLPKQFCHPQSDHPASSVRELATEDGRFERIGADTIDRLCAFFGVAPGDLFARDAETGARRRQTRSR